MTRVSVETLHETVARAFVNAGMGNEKAGRRAKIRAEPTLRKRSDPLADGILVDDGVWAGVFALAGQKA